MVSTALPEPSGQGILAKTPFPHLILYAYERVLDGTIDLAAPRDETATIVFVHGQPAKARTSEPVAYLGRVLLELGFFNETQLTATLQTAAQDKRLHGQVLLASGLISQEQLDLGLRQQLMRKLRYLARLPPETEFRYYDGVDALRSYGGDARVSIDPCALVWTAIREAPSWEHVHLALERVGPAGLRLAQTAELDRFGFEKGERAAAELLRARPRSAQDVAAAGVVDPRLSQQVLYCLLLAKQIELVHESLIPLSASADEPPVSTPVRLPADPVEQQRFIAAQFAQADSATSTAPPPAARPPRPPNPELHTRPTTPSMRSVHLPHPQPNPQGAASAAPAPEPASHAPLPRPHEADEGFILDRRAQFALSETPAPMNPAAQGLENYQAAQAFLKGGELDKAEARLKQASVYDPENADYVALHGYVLGLRAENRGRVPTELAIEKLDKALRMNPMLAQAYYHRAQLHERLGREEEALTDLRKAVELDSSHVEAQREIRMIEVRKQKKGEEEKSGGLLGKLFGKSSPPKR